MTKAIVEFADAPPIREAIAAGAEQLGYVVEFVPRTDDLIAFLVARQPWLILVELCVTSRDWERLVIEVKTSPATRKLPILAIGPDANPTLLARAKQAGCDAAVRQSAFVADAAGMIHKHARLDESEELARQAREPLPEMAHTAIEQFNAGEYFEQHETFEHLWRAEPGPVRQMYQGILQVGVAYYQIKRRNYVGACKLFQRAWQYLSALPDVCRGVDIAQLRADAQAAQAELERLGPERIAEFPPELMKPVRYATPASAT